MDLNLLMVPRMCVKICSFKEKCQITKSVQL